MPTCCERVSPRDRRVAHPIDACLVLIVSVCLGLFATACQETASESGDDGETAAQTRIVLTEVETAPRDELPARIVRHFDNMRELADALNEFCRAMGPDMKMYLELATPDFEAASEAELSDEERAEIGAAYHEFAMSTTRCISDPEGRAFAERLQELVGPLDLPTGG